MALASTADRGELRSAIEGLLRGCVELERRTADAVAQTQARVRRVTGTLAAVRLPAQVLDAAGLAQEVDGIGRRLGTDLAGRLAEARRPYVTEVHALLGLLAPLHGLGPIPSLAPVAPAVSLDGSFPAGFARAYVADLLTGVHRSTALPRDGAAAVAVVAQQDADEAIADSRAGFSDDRRSDGVELLVADECHAAERHGPQIPAAAHLARLLWLKDPTGGEPWRIDQTGAVITDHWAGPATGGFTSPEALAKPLDTFLAAAHTRAADMTAFLNDSTDDDEVAINIYVGADLAGLRAGDTFGYRAAGAGTQWTKRDWIKARRYGMSTGRSTVYGVPYDPVAEGAAPGASLFFRRIDTAWVLVTCYPVDEPAATQLRLEDLL